MKICHMLTMPMETQSYNKKMAWATSVNNLHLLYTSFLLYAIPLIYFYLENCRTQLANINQQKTNYLITILQQNLI